MLAQRKVNSSRISFRSILSGRFQERYARQHTDSCRCDAFCFAATSFLIGYKGGYSAIFSTTGNSDCHIIMRGGGGKANYDSDNVDRAAALLAKSKQTEKVMIDFSHANSSKQFERQLIVAEDVAQQLRAGERRIMGVMIESHLVEGRQDLQFNSDGTLDKQRLVYGQSITDACLGWEDTTKVLEILASAVQAGRV